VEWPAASGDDMSTSASVPRFFVDDAFAAHSTVLVGEDAARHIRVRRLGPGSPVMMLDGRGGRAQGTVRTVARRSATIEVESVDSVAALPDVHLLVPIADRDRMLWLAEKATEFGVTSWRPVMWRRSRSVSPKGEGPVFQGKVLARMVSALEQSGNAWLPATYPDSPIDRALAAIPVGRRVVLDANGDDVGHALSGAQAPVTLAVGPEGGLDDEELAALDAAGFTRASLGANTLRFETAAIAALAFARTALTRTELPR
jgi:16S rRNA (uracil1498-N3)-methyltransferase